MLRGYGVHDVVVTGGTLLSNRALRKGAGDTLGVGIDLQGSSRVTCEGVVIRGMSREGVQIAPGSTGAPCATVTLRDCEVDSCRVSGIAIRGLEGGEVRGCRTKLNVGALCGAGISIEAPGASRARHRSCSCRIAAG